MLFGGTKVDEDNSDAAIIVFGDNDVAASNVAMLYARLMNATQRVYN